jgi:hypothetical protein
MVITNCSLNSQTTCQYFKYGSSKSFHSHCGSFFGELEIKPQKGLYEAPLFEWSQHFSYLSVDILEHI